MRGGDPMMVWLLRSDAMEGEGGREMRQNLTTESWGKNQGAIG